MPALVVALLLTAHGLVHVSFVTSAPAPKAGAPTWPFDLAHSRLLAPLRLAPGALRAIGRALLVVTVAGYALSALALLGVAPEAWFAPAVIVASLASAAMLAVFFHPWLVLGFVIDAVLVWAVLANGWQPGSVG